MSLASRVIFKDFLEEFNEKGIDWNSMYNKKWGEWTKVMLGDGASRKKEEKDYGILGRIGQKYKYEIQAEWKRIDQIWFYRIPGPYSKPDVWITDVAIEHDNYPENIEFNILKLSEFVADLKVIVTYPKETNHKSILEKIGALVSKCSVIQHERYLFLFGNHNGGEKITYDWRAYEFNTKGDHIEVPG